MQTRNIPLEISILDLDNTIPLIAKYVFNYEPFSLSQEEQLVPLIIDWVEQVDADGNVIKEKKLVWVQVSNMPMDDFVIAEFKKIFNEIILQKYLLALDKYNKERLSSINMVN